MENRAGAGQAYYPSSYPPGYYQSFAVEQAPPPSQVQRGRSWLVPCFVIANVAVFIVSMYVNNCPDGSTVCIMGALGRLSFQPLSENPLFGPSSATLEKMGALNSTKVIADHEGWRLISCIWLHAGVIHLLANMLSLCFIGIRLEQEFGFWRIGIIYLMSGFGGSLLSVLFLQNRISVGASGALFGLLGAMLSELFTNWPTYTGKCGALTTLIFIIALNLAIGMLPHVDNFAHIGGFVSGFLLGFVLLLRANVPTTITRSNHKAYQYFLLVLALILLIIGYAVAISMVFRGIDGNKHCSWCHYLSCVPSSRWSCHNPGPYLCQYTLEMNGTIYVTCQSNNATQSFLGSTNSSNPGLSQLCNQVCS